MAPPVGDRYSRRAMRLLYLLAPFPGRLEFAARLALVCALTTLVAEIYQTPDPALTVYVAFFLIKPDRVTSIILSLVMLAVITVTLLLVLLAAVVVIDQPMWRVAAMTIISFGLMFLASASKLRPIAPIVALIAVYALDLLGTIQIGEIATRALLYVWLFVGMPAGVSIAVNLLLGPAPRRLAERALAHRLRLAAAMLRGPDQTVRRAFGAALREGVSESLAWLKLAGMEKTSTPAAFEALRQAAGSAMRIMLLTDMVDRMPASTPGPEATALMAEKLDGMAAILQAGSYPIDIEWAAPRAVTETSMGSAWFAEFRASLIQFAVAPAPSSGASAAAKPRDGFLLPDAFSNPAHVYHALKTTGAAMFCYILYSLLNWPTIHTCLITCYIVALGTAAETVEKLSLRILGCILGAAAGIAAIVFLVPDLTSIGSLMIVVFLVSLASAWVAAGDERIAYAGFQIAFAFFLSVIQGAGPSFDMVTARDRVIGILLGNVVVYLTFTLFWPVSVANRIDPAMAALLRKLGAMLTEGGRATALAASEAQAALGELERDLELSAYEPASIRRSPEWLRHRRSAADDMAALAGVLFLVANQDPNLSRDMAGRLGRLADGIGGATRLDDEEPAPATPSARGASPLAELRGWIEARLKSVEELQAPLAARSKSEAVSHAAV
jgi:multidrug resistance protein MdtO